MIERQTVKINDIEISYLLKRAVNPVATIIYIHGFPFSSEIWTAQLADLDRNIQGIAYDIRGFGESTTSHPFFSIDLFARDLEAFISAMNLEIVVLCGVSMGGYIALRAAERAVVEISGLILCDTNAGADPDAGKLKRFAAIDQVLKEGVDTFADIFTSGLFSDKTITSGSPVPSFIGEIIKSTPSSVICSTQLALASRTDTSSFLSSLDMPVLVIRGADDKLMTQEQAEELKVRIKGAELALIPDSGHLPNLENPGVFNLKMQNYLKKHFLS